MFSPRGESAQRAGPGRRRRPLTAPQPPQRPPAASTPPLPAASVAALSRQAARTHRKFFMKILTMEPSIKRGRCLAARGAPAAPGFEAPALRSSHAAAAAAILGPRSAPRAGGARAAGLLHGGKGGAHRRAQPPRGLSLVRSALGGFLLAGREGGGAREGALPRAPSASEDKPRPPARRARSPRAPARWRHSRAAAGRLRQAQPSAAALSTAWEAAGGRRRNKMK